MTDQSVHLSQRRAAGVIVGKTHVPLELQFSASATVRYLTTTHLSLLTMSV